MSDRSNKDSPTGLAAYFQTINDIFALQTKFLTGALPHYGERGRNDEQRLVKLLRQVLPHKYSLGTGFVICSHHDVPPSRQTDIVIHDEVQNSPLFRELAADVYPIECVYGTVSVKATLSIDELRDCFGASSELRKMASRGKFYAHYAVDDDAVNSETGVGKGVEVQFKTALSPRGYIVGYDADAATPESFLSRVATVIGEIPTFVHGIYAIKQQWFFNQKHSSTEFMTFTDHALLSFVSKLLGDMQSYDMYPMAFSRYVQNERLRQVTQESETDRR